jgi:hypothetical protein
MCALGVGLVWCANVMWWARREGVVRFMAKIEW